jgi:hypothetical protein
VLQHPPMSLHAELSVKTIVNFHSGCQMAHTTEERRHPAGVSTVAPAILPRATAAGTFFGTMSVQSSSGAVSGPALGIQEGAVAVRSIWHARGEALLPGRRTCQKVQRAPLGHHSRCDQRQSAESESHASTRTTSTPAAWQGPEAGAKPGRGSSWAGPLAPLTDVAVVEARALGLDDVLACSLRHGLEQQLLRVRGAAGVCVLGARSWRCGADGRAPAGCRPHHCLGHGEARLGGDRLDLGVLLRHRLYPAQREDLHGASTAGTQARL